MTDIIHDPQQQAFLCVVDGHEARLRYRVLDQHQVDAYSTFVPGELRGQGLADKLARAFFDWTQARGLTIIPSCSYIETWLRRHAG
ncbi:GNAT family N-acetyltransferase [Aeromonas bivalvium]|uniref:GNAT family N-acetyltransferase n=1 Tax=Aeromonas bivalvium TaxID=440079 RepID=A0ABW9GLN1_9GAMM|nr:GNAT family N-acetyltransferase [Aeromonas bivalvium]